MYGDFFWMQDFPFFNKSKPDLKKLNRMRIEMELLSPLILTPLYFDVFEKSRQTRIRLLKQHTCATNTQTYDNVYFRERSQNWSSRTITSSQSPQVPAHSPLAEVLLVQVGFVQSRTKRFYNRLHREYISRISKEAAGIVTTSGTSARSDFASMSVDSIGFAKEKARKVGKKIGQLVMNKTVLANKGNDKNVDAAHRILHSPRGVKSLDTLKAQGIIKDSVTYENINPRFRSNFLVLGWFLDTYGKDRLVR